MLRVVLFFSAALASVLPVCAEPLVFAPLPMETPQTVASQWQPFLHYLELKLGITLQVDSSETNAEIVDKFKNGKIDLAYLGPLPYITLKNSFPAAEPLVIFNEKNGQPFYTCALISSGEAALNLEGMKGRKVALTQPLSTCGYFATQGILNHFGISLEDNRYRYLGQHDEVALAVVRGEFDAGGLKTAIAKKYTHLGVVVRAESPPITGLALVANTQHLSRERIEQIRQSLLGASSEIRQQWGDNIRHGVSPAKDSDYDGIRKLPAPERIPGTGNF